VRNQLTQSAYQSVAPQLRGAPIGWELKWRWNSSSMSATEFDPLLQQTDSVLELDGARRSGAVSAR
jgi:hypothetical protein